MAWQKKFNDFAPLKAPSLAEALATQKALYQWASLSGQWARQAYKQQVTVTNTAGPAFPVFTKFPDLVTNVQVTILTITITQYSDSLDTGVMFSVDNQGPPLSGVYALYPLGNSLTNAFSPFLQPYFISGGWILGNVYGAVATPQTLQAGNIWVAGTPTTSGQAVTVINVGITIQQKLEAWAVNIGTQGKETLELKVDYQVSV